jgi:ATP-binding cassette subfamily F protein 3
LPEKKTVLDYLRGEAAFGKKEQEILDLAGAFLFRGSHVRKEISVLSGGERARLCLAGLLLSNYNVLILDEPGNHLDVDTVEVLADALVEYEGTLIFTSHDRHFMKKVASSVIEVRDGRVINYSGQYEAYLTKVNEEIEAGERELASERTKLPPDVVKRAPVAAKPARRSERDVRKELKMLERTIAQLDEQKRAINEQLLKSTDSAEALRLHNEVSALAEPLAQAEERWCELQEQIEGGD